MYAPLYALYNGNSERAEPPEPAGGPGVIRAGCLQPARCRGPANYSRNFSRIEKAIVRIFIADPVCVKEKRLTDLIIYTLYVINYHSRNGFSRLFFSHANYIIRAIRM